MTYMERISRSPLTSRDKRRATMDAERLRKRGAKRMLAKASEELRSDVIAILAGKMYDTFPMYDMKPSGALLLNRSPAVATWMAKV